MRKKQENPNQENLLIKDTGIIIGDDCVLVADTQATPAMAAGYLSRMVCAAISTSSRG